MDASVASAAPTALLPGEPATGDPSATLQWIAESVGSLTRARGVVVLLAEGPAAWRVCTVAGEVPASVGDLLRKDAHSIVWLGDHPPSSLAPAQRDGERVPPLPTEALELELTACGIPMASIVALAPAAASLRDAAVLASMDELRRRAVPAAAMRRVAMLEAQLTEGAAIVEVGQVLTGLLDMEDVLSYVVYLAESLVGGHSAGVALRTDGAGDALVLKNSSGSLRDDEGVAIPPTGNLIGWVAERGQPVVSPCLSQDPRGYTLHAPQGPGVVVPIVNCGQILGAFVVARIEGSPGFSTESVTVLQRMSAYAAIAITNAAIHRKQQESASALRSKAEELEEAYSTLRRSQEQLLTSEKMAALGRVTAGIAHEINSPLGGILTALGAARGFVDEYQRSVVDPEITVEDHSAIAGDMLSAIGTAESAATKVAQFVRSIKTQTRSGAGDRTVFDAAAEVDGTVVLLQHELKRRRVSVYTDMQPGLRLCGDQAQFGMVIQNLISNAVDAYDDRPGEIWVRTARRDDMLELKVEDRGSGIPEEVRGKIFDYLFTTKDVGKGTGLGLSMVHSVVTTNFHGTIALDSEVGRGTTFTLSIPLAAAESPHGA